MKNKLFSILTIFLCLQLHAEDVFLEAEDFCTKGGWSVDQQFMESMGSSYLLAHGLSQPVAPAETSFRIKKAGPYHIYARTYNWTAPWSDKKGPGAFAIAVNGVQLEGELGTEGSVWQWQYAGEVDLSTGIHAISLIDLCGLDARCDAVFLTDESGKLPPEEAGSLKRFREKYVHPKLVRKHEKYDLVIAGAGIAGISAAVAAARCGCRVALVNDRPVIGGNNSSEVRVHLGGRISLAPYPKLGVLLYEFGPEKLGNAMPAGNYEDDKKLEILSKEPSIDLFVNYRVTAAKVNKGKIKEITATHIESGDKLILSGRLYSDCTGDGTLGYLSGADYMYGRESQSEYNESGAPVQRDSLVMGTSVQWYSVETGEASSFPIFDYGITFNKENCEAIFKGDWDWETGMRENQIANAERIRDYGLLVIFSNWSFLKNSTDAALKEKFKNRKLEWVAYVAGKRESRRLVGDYVLHARDLKERNIHEDGTACCSWTIDLHYPSDAHLKRFPGKEFKSKAVHDIIYPYPIPYRCLYSRNIDNLFMAGRNISVTHIALGTTRVMRTTGMLGEVVGMAASICKKHGVVPRDIYRSYLEELKDLMKKGVGKENLPDNQQYNLGSSSAF